MIIVMAVRSLIWYGIGMVVVKAVCVLIGFVMYAKYSSCDPLTTKKVTKNDQLVPYFVMDVAKDVPGLSGIFIAGIVSAGLRLFPRFIKIHLF
jgi:sodium-coupled monocarboxylate transporter 8/12